MTALPLSTGDLISPAQAMELALREAVKGVGHVAPNPLVGCTIVDSHHRLLSVGYHEQIGFDHAEIHALKRLRRPELIDGAHIYVTLEPCAHQGRTPSCARTLAKLKPASVTYAVEDPNPLVAGKGAAILREAGIDTKTLLLRDNILMSDRERLVESAEALAEIFLFNQRSSETFVAVKVASTLDGMIAVRSTGESQWITGEAARHHGHWIRAHYDAMLIGRGTYLKDNPSLNIRHPAFPDLRNRAIILDPLGETLATLPESNLLKVRDAGRVFVLVGEKTQAHNPAGVQVFPMPLTAKGEFAIADILGTLKTAGVNSVLIEGGAGTIGEFIRAGRVQRLHLYLAPSLIGSTGLPWNLGFGVGKLDDRVQLTNIHHETLSGDLYCTGRIRHKVTRKA
jgi:diaminohydroxyphosphoribosylaminopyrimidine deaminase/5-amino-6-(5-phosphoribosylamino)uracil reductase